MHCRSCEILIEDKLKEIPEIKSVQISYKKRLADIYSKKRLDLSAVNSKILEAGYEVGEDKPKSWITTNPEIYKDLTKCVIILAVLYFLLSRLGVFNLSAGSLSNPSSLIVVVLIGITAGFSSCMALVGGLILGISARHSEKHPEATPIQKFRPHLFFNIGRISSYFLLGGMIGLIGKAFQLSGPTLGVLTIVVGIVMLIVGLQLTELSPRLANVSFSLPGSISKFIGIKKHHEKEYSHTNSMMVGALTFFLPCGFTQAMQLYAMSTGNFWQGALVMGAFALGTAPGLLGVGGLTSVIKGAFARRFFKFAGIIVTILAILNISNGLNLTGLGSKLSFGNFSSAKNLGADTNVTTENGVQIVRMTQTGSGYQPNSFIVKKGIPVKWIVDSKDPNSCAASLFSQDLNIRKFLKPGENTFEFTPDKVGLIPFSCSMGMYRGSFTVVDNDSGGPKDQTPSQNTGQNSALPQPSPSPSAPPPAASTSSAQVIRATYAIKTDIQPNQFNVKVGNVRLEVLAQEDGSGCMSSITVPELTEDYDVLTKGKTSVFELNITKPGKYYITCAMGSRRGLIIAQ